jgi:hypothetical protein
MAYITSTLVMLVIVLLVLALPRSSKQSYETDRVTSQHRGDNLRYITVMKKIIRDTRTLAKEMGPRSEAMNREILDPDILVRAANNPKARMDTVEWLKDDLHLQVGEEVIYGLAKNHPYDSWRVSQQWTSEAKVQLSATKLLQATCSTSLPEWNNARIGPLSVLDRLATFTIFDITPDFIHQLELMYAYSGRSGTRWDDVGYCHLNA